MKKKMKKLITSIIILVVILAGVVLYVYRDNFFGEKSIIKNIIKDKDKEEVVKKLKILDLKSNTRPIALMIDNVQAAWPQAGLGDAYLVYEIIVEGGQTRIMAVFKDQDTAMIGPVRSSRHYYLDYALENDAIYGHFGWSPQAQRDITALKVNNLNGITNGSSAYWRASDVYAPHNVFTSMEKLTNRATSLGYRLTTEEDTLLNYSIDEIDLSKDTNSVVANSVSARYSSSHYSSYTYDSVKKVYNRFMLGIEHTDKVTGEQYTAKNIIIIDVANHADPDNSDKGRQALENIGTGTGYYVTDGYAIPITWEKASRTSQTVYKKINGEEIIVNDGNTYIQIKPTIQSTTIS